MNTKKRNIILLFLNLSLVGSFNTLDAGTGGSGFSRYGLGDLQYNRSTAAIGMGGTGISIVDPTHINRLTPAGWTKISHTRFTIDAMYQGFSISDNSDKTFLSSIVFNGFDLAIPVSIDNGVVVGAGLLPFSRVNYNIVSQELFGDKYYDLSYVGEGGLSVAHIGGSLILSNDFHIGGKLNYTFGTINHNIKQSFATEGYTSFELFRSTRMHGLSGTLGLIYSGFDKLLSLKDTEKLNAGIIFTTSSNLKTEAERWYDYMDKGGIIARDTIQTVTDKIKIPAAFGFGASYIHNNRYQFAADYSFRNWEKANLSGLISHDIKNGSRISLGAEILPVRTPKATDWQKVGYRAGFYYDQTYYNIKGEPINETGFTLGSDFPVFGETRLSIGLEYVLRGTKNLQKDNIFKISFGLEGAELWFVRPEED